VGYPADIDYLDMMFTSVRTHLSANISPKASRSLTEEQNIALLKEAGMKWQDVFYEMCKAGFYPESNGVWARRYGVRFTKVYTDHCAREGKHRTYASPTVYRRSFLSGYTGEVRQRLYAMREHRKEEVEEKGYGIVLANRADQIKDLLYELFPDKKPHPPECDCDRCHSRKCHDPNCTRRGCVAKRKPVRYSRVSDPVVDRAVIKKGRQVGATADLSGGRGHMPGRKEIG
jgi:hypothetical protein